jgi:HD-like signal output (HDOD) protein
MQRSEKVKYQVQQLKQLPALSTTVTQLLAMLSDENLEIDELASVIERDPTLTARIIGLANAAYFAQTRPITSVSEAIIRVLGLQMVKTLALSIALCGAFNTSRCPGFKLDEYWFRAFGSAQLARKLVLRMDAKLRPDADEVYLTALLRDIGVLVLVHEFPEEYALVVAELNQEPDLDPEALEQRHVGISSRQAGEWLTDRWHLPRFIVHAIAGRDGILTQETPHSPAIQVIALILDWLHQPQQGALCSLFENSRLGQDINLSAEQLNNIEVDFIQQIEEIKEIAKLLAT